MLISTFVFLFFLFLVYALFALASRKSDAKKARLQQRVNEVLRDLEGEEPGNIQISREDSIGGSTTVNRILTSLDFVKKLDEVVKQADIHITVSRLLCFSILAGIMAAFAALTISSVMLAAISFALAAAAPILYVMRKRSQRLALFNAQLPDTLDLLSRSLAVGHAFSESLNQVAMEMPDPIAMEFRLTFEEQKLGLGIKQALVRLTERVPLTDLKLCVTAIHIQRETGGNLAEILEKVSETIRERFKFAEDFRTLTTSSRASGWILCALPFAICLGLVFLSPDYMAVLLYDTRGHYVIVFAIIWQIFGMLLIRKFLNLRV
jgi:tight adherence protein B